jgi:hypothetical protein
LIWPNAISDALTAIAFFATAFVLADYESWRRRDMLVFRCAF